MADATVWDFQCPRGIPTLTTSLEGLEGIINIADDIRVFGTGTTYEDPVMAKLGNAITRGWPTGKAHLDLSLQPF